MNIISVEILEQEIGMERFVHIVLNERSSLRPRSNGAILLSSFSSIGASASWKSGANLGFRRMIELINTLEV